jgi:hypothetical protein
MTNTCTILFRKPEDKRPLWKPIIKMNVKEMEYVGLFWIRQWTFALHNKLSKKKSARHKVSYIDSSDANSYDWVHFEIGIEVLSYANNRNLRLIFMNGVHQLVTFRSVAQLKKSFFSAMCKGKVYFKYPSVLNCNLCSRSCISVWPCGSFCSHTHLPLPTPCRS